MKFLSLIFTMGILMSSKAWAYSNYIARISHACTPDESWVLGSLVPKNLREKRSKPPSSKDEAIDLLFEAFNLKLTNRRPEIQQLADYLIYRSYSVLNLHHFAQRGFISLLNRPISLASVDLVLASLNCLGRTAQQHASMEIPRNALSSLAKVDSRYLDATQKAAFNIGVFQVARAKLAYGVKKGDVAQELSLLPPKSPERLFIEILELAETAQHQELVARSITLLRTPKLSDAIRKHLDAIYINLARARYTLKEYAEAIRAYKRVPPSSRYFAASLVEKAWAHLLLKDYSSAVAGGYSFKVGEFKNNFSPDSMVIVGISLYENCHYQDALDTIKLFKKKYNLTYRYLYNWYYKQKSAPVNYYNLVLQYISKGSGLPKNLALEWIRSPRFVALQDEINLLFEERKDAAAVANDVTRQIAKAPKARKFFLTKLRGALVQLVHGIPAIQAKVIGRVNAELIARNYSMIGSLVESFENSQLLEAEILRAMGENVLNKQERALYEKKVKEHTKKSGDEDRVPTLNWGTVSTDEEEDQEIWDDELGAYRTDVSNVCPKK